MEPTVISQAKSNLRAFNISGLFGNRDVTLKFDRPINILLGENGLGKTTVLNALYYTLTCNLSKLSAIVFEKITLKFWHGEDVEFDKADIIEEPGFEMTYDINYERHYRHERDITFAIERFVSPKEIKFLRVMQDKGSEKEFNLESRRIASKIADYAGVTISMAHRVLLSILTKGGSKINAVRERIKSEFEEDILYLPTYRRIEEELHNLGTNKVEFDKRNKLLIQFGMKDVNDTFSNVLLNIKNSALNGFAKITGDMLKQYVTGLGPLDESTAKKIKPGILQIILARVGENITEFYKEEIISLVSTGKIFEEVDQYRYLINFLSNLIDVYDEQSVMDNAIKNFASVCNKYLYGKKMIYNESKVTLGIFQNKDGSEIELRNLSSGEKQIISLFTKIYLETGSKLMVLFDEPELSLSIEWQRILLPDVVNSGKCNFLLAVTHSPFVFENELDSMAEDMTKYVIER